MRLKTKSTWNSKNRWSSPDETKKMATVRFFCVVLSNRILVALHMIA